MYVPFIPTYVVTLTIKRAGTSPLAMCQGAMKIRSIFGARAAGRRAKWTAVMADWGTGGELDVASVQRVAA